MRCSIRGSLRLAESQASLVLNPLFLALQLSQESGEDAALIKRLQRKDPKAMAELYRRFSRLAYSVIVAIVRDHGTAEDLLQEAFLRVWNRAHAFDAERGAIGPWLLAIARNRAIDYLRSAGARMAVNCFELEDRDQPSLFVDMEHTLFTAATAEKIRRAMSKLNENQRRVVQLAYYEGLSQSEMSERLNQPLGTVKTWVRTALRDLRAELGVEDTP